MKRIIVTGATSMIGTALIEECIRHDIEVYAVVRAGSSKTKRLPESARIHHSGNGSFCSGNSSSVFGG